LQQYIQLVNRHWPMLGFGFITVFWGNFGQSFFVSWFGADLQSSLGLSATAYGSAYSAATLASGLAIMGVGGIIDRVPLRHFTTAVGLGLMSAALVLSFANNLMLLVAGFFLLRLFGQGLLPHTGFTTMARYFDDSRGKAVSIAGSGIPLGEVLLPAIIVALIEWIGWQNSWRAVAITIPLLYLPLANWLLARSQYREDETPATDTPSPDGNPTSALEGGRRQLLADYRFWLILPALLAAPFILTGIFIHQGFILEEKGWSPALMAVCFVIYGLMHWLGSMATGILVDYWQAARLLPFYLLPMATGMFIAAELTGAWAAVLMMASLGTTIGSSVPIFGALWAEVYGTSRLGSIRSLITALMVLSSSASPALLGYLIDNGTSAAYLLKFMAGYAATAILLTLLSYRPTVATS
jgi:sugar phosphate permease